MTHFLKDPLYHGRAMELQLMNATINCHDLCCGCLTPVLHLKEIINTFSYSPCPRTTGAGDDHHGDKETTDALEGLEDGELDRLFADDGEDNAG